MRNREGRLGDLWHLDELFVTIQGKRFYLCRAVDQDAAADPAVSDLRRHPDASGLWLLTGVTRRVTLGAVIKRFADRHTQALYVTGKSRRIPPDVVRRAVRKLEYVDLATCLDDLRVPPGNRLHALERERRGQYAMAVNDQWRICFRFVDSDAYDVEITDYH